jgi:O-antigen ligase
MGMALAGCGTLWLASYVVERRRRVVRPARRPWTISRKSLYVLAFVAGALWLALRYTDELGALRYTYVLLDRLEELGETPPGVEGALEGRLFHWGLGLERVQLAPLLGIAMPPPELTSEASALHYATPHNEFIFFWSAYGLFGLVAHLFLLGYLLVLNIRSRSGLPWILFYLSLIGQMFFDAAFQAVRFQVMFFLIAGLNIRHLLPLGKAKARIAPAVGAARA